MRKLCLLALFAWATSVPPALAQAPLPPAATRTVDYDADVRPILAQNCYSCHGPEAQQSGLRLDLRQNALRGGDYGPVITPGNSADSKLIKRLVNGDGGLQMPPTGPLSDDEIGILRAWIDQGPTSGPRSGQRRLRGPSIRKSPPSSPPFARAIARHSRR